MRARKIGYSRTQRAVGVGRRACFIGKWSRQPCGLELGKSVGILSAIPTRLCCVAWARTSNCNRNYSANRPCRARWTSTPKLFLSKNKRRTARLWLWCFPTHSTLIGHQRNHRSRRLVWMGAKWSYLRLICSFRNRLKRMMGSRFRVGCGGGIWTRDLWVMSDQCFLLVAGLSCYSVVYLSYVPGCSCCFVVVFVVIASEMLAQRLLPPHRLPHV